MELYRAVADLERRLADARRVAQYETAVAESEIEGRKHAEQLVVACPCCGGPVRHTCEDCGETFYGPGSSMRLSTRRFAPALRATRELLREARTHVHMLDDAWVGPWCERVAAVLEDV